jgi:DNA-binding response OmpR family regulator
MPAETKILIVEDDPTVCLVLNHLLTSSGYRVIECHDGVEAIAHVSREEPALILLDVQMPRMDGWETLTELRRRGCRVPVLMLTAAGDVPARVKGLEAGADDYIGKPCETVELLARVKALVRRSRMLPHTPLRLRFGDLVVDMERKEARRGEELVKLTRKEYALLELFAQNRDKPVSRERMLDAVWGMADSPNSHTVDTCLWRLRRKLGDGGGESGWIRNLPGMGYVLECEIQEVGTPD